MNTTLSFDSDLRRDMDIATVTEATATHMKRMDIPTAGVERVIATT